MRHAIIHTYDNGTSVLDLTIVGAAWSKNYSLYRWKGDDRYILAHATRCEETNFSSPSLLRITLGQGDELIEILDLIAVEGIPFPSATRYITCYTAEVEVDRYRKDLARHIKRARNITAAFETKISMLEYRIKKHSGEPTW